MIKKADTPRSYIVQRCAGGVPLRRNRQHLRPTGEQWCAGDLDENVLDDVDFYIDSQLNGDREMVGSEPSLRTAVFSPYTQEMVGSEPSLRSVISAAGTREMVGSEPSLRPAMLAGIDRNQATNSDSSSAAASSYSEPRYPKRKRVSPEYYQAGM